MILRHILLISLLCTVLITARRHYSDEEDDLSTEDNNDIGTQKTSLVPNTKRLAGMLPSKEAMESFGVKFLDALIKKGQMEMAKGAFKTQLEVLQKVNPDQYAKYKHLKVDDLAADAVMQQAQMAKMQPKTGNNFVDMLHENGIPIGSSLKGIEQALKTQKEIENNDPTEQIAKAVFDKFREQILPGMVANIISGRNPFKMPARMRPMQPTPELMRQQAMAQQQGSITMDAPELGLMENNKGVRRSQPASHRQTFDDEASDGYSGHKNYRQSENLERDTEGGTAESHEEVLERRLRHSPRLAALLDNPRVAAALYSRSRMRDEPVGRSLSDRDPKIHYNPLEALGARSALALGFNELGADDSDEDSDEQEKETVRRAPMRLNSKFVNMLSSNPEIAAALQSINYKVNDVDDLLVPKKQIFNPKPQPGFFVPRKIPTRPRKMIPILVGVPDVDHMVNTPFGPIRRAPSEADFKPASEHYSRVLQNLKNNPNIAPLFLNPELETKLRGRELLTPEQRGLYESHKMVVKPRLFGAKMHEVTELDKQVKQVIEERPVPPLLFIPKGRHTRLRWTGATEKEIPGIGTRMILPSLDPTAPAVNTAYSTQGRARDEWDTMLKIPNDWQPGDEVGFNVKQKSERFIGGDGGFDMPALGT